MGWGQEAGMSGQMMFCGGTGVVTNAQGEEAGKFSARDGPGGSLEASGGRDRTLLPLPAAMVRASPGFLPSSSRSNACKGGLPRGNNVLTQAHIVMFPSPEIHKSAILP